MRIRSNRCIDIYRYLVSELKPNYGEDEAKALSRDVLGHFIGFKPSEMVLHYDVLASESMLLKINSVKNKLRKNVPLQYLLSRAWFMDLSFYVNEHVLIPRPETEELVLWAAEVAKNVNNPVILDVGTGSGCIAVSLKRLLPNAIVYGIDVSQNALIVASVNADTYSCNVTLRHHDILDRNSSLMAELPDFDLIISNPPYIPANERESLPENVRNFEPEIALFTPENEPLKFYKAIMDFAVQKLSVQGFLLFETHDTTADELENLMMKDGFQTELRRDINGRKRMIKGVL